MFVEIPPDLSSSLSYEIEELEHGFLVLNFFYLQ